jgi:hypothetical protein
MADSCKWPVDVVRIGTFLKAAQSSYSPYSGGGTLSSDVAGMLFDVSGVT